MANSAKTAFQPDSDIHISFEDQQHINKFATLNAKYDDLKDEIKIRENDMQSMEDACDEIALFDDDELIPYLVGEAFIYQNLEKTQQSLEQAKENINVEMKELKRKMGALEDEMRQLKVVLYGKFGTHINLEPDE